MRKLLALVVTLSFIAGPLFATQTRVNSLGIQNWMIEEDDNLLWMNPARTADYSKQVWVEASDTLGVNVNGAAARNWGGITGKCPIVDGATLGLFVNRPYWGNMQNAVPAVEAAAMPGYFHTASPLTPNAGAGNPLVSANTQLDINGAVALPTRFELLYVLPSMGKMNVGARLSSAGDTQNESLKLVNMPGPGGDAEWTDKRSAQDTNVTLGAKISDAGPFSVLDAVVSLDMPSAKDTFTGDRYQNAILGTIRKYDWELKLAPSMNIGITARGKLLLKGNPLIVYLNYNNADYTSDLTVKTDANNNGDYIDAGDTNYTQKRTQTQATTMIGAAYNSQMSKKTLLIVGGGLQNQVTVYGLETTPADAAYGQVLVQENYKTTTTNMQVGANIGVEHIVSKVVTGRLGMRQLIMESNALDLTDKAYSNSGTAFVQDAKADRSTLTENLGATVVTYGVGINVLQNLTIDALVAQEIQFTGGFIFSGVNQKYITQLTATYKF